MMFKCLKTHFSGAMVSVFMFEFETIFKTKYSNLIIAKQISGKHPFFMLSELLKFEANKANMRTLSFSSNLKLTVQILC